MRITHRRAGRRINLALGQALAIGLMTVAVAASAATYYVDVDWTGPYSGKTNEPYKTIKAAVDAASTSAAPRIVYIAAGTYADVANGGTEDYSAGGGSDHGILITNVMTVAGGYAGWQGGTTFDWTTRTSRATIIDLQGAASRAFRAQWLSGNGPSSGPTFEGLTFQNANVTNDGGAIHVAEQNYWTAYVTNCLFTNNTTTTGNGGAVRLGSAYVSGAIRSSDFIGNRAATNGGAVAFYVGQGTPMVEDCTFLRNTATVSRGGAIWWDGTGGPVQAVRRCRFEGNVAALSGGAAFSKDPYIQFDRCLFVSNTAPAGAAVGGADYWCGATRCRTALCMAIPAGMPCNRRVRESTTTPSTFSILPS